MKNRPIHENLDTSFVNLSALIKYLRRRQFVGNVKVQLNGYDAEIQILKDNQMKVSEHDHISGRVSEGEEALQRILIRARETGGTINVYQLIEEDSAIEKPVTKQPLKADTHNAPKAKTETEPVLEITGRKINPKALEKAVRKNGTSQNGTAQNKTAKNVVELPKTKKRSLETKTAQTQQDSDPKDKKQETSLPDFPFSLTNQFENRARERKISKQDWQTLLKLTVELLSVIDKSLAKENLDFTAAFRKACLEISDDYPFLNPDSQIFDYARGKIRVKERVNPKIFVISIFEAVRLILDKLASNAKFNEVHRSTVQTLIALLHKRKDAYDKFSITPQLKRILGI